MAGAASASTVDSDPALSHSIVDSVVGLASTVDSDPALSHSTVVSDPALSHSIVVSHLGLASTVVSDLGLASIVDSVVGLASVDLVADGKVDAAGGSIASKMLLTTDGGLVSSNVTAIEKAAEEFKRTQAS